MSELKEPKSLSESMWPAVSSAYDFVMPSYQFLLARYEAADTRLTNVVTISATLTLGAPVVGRAVRPDIAFNEPLFILAMVLFTAGAVIGLLGRVLGSLVLPNPLVLYEESLTLPKAEFEQEAIYHAGVNFSRNMKTIQVKRDIAVFVTASLIAEVLAVITWITQ